MVLAACGAQALRRAEEPGGARVWPPPPRSTRATVRGPCTRSLLPAGRRLRCMAGAGTRAAGVRVRGNGQGVLRRWRDDRSAESDARRDRGLRRAPAVAELRSMIDDSAHAVVRVHRSMADQRARSALRARSRRPDRRVGGVGARAGGDLAQHRRMRVTGTGPPRSGDAHDQQRDVVVAFADREHRFDRVAEADAAICSAETSPSAALATICASASGSMPCGGATSVTPSV